MTRPQQVLYAVLRTLVVGVCYALFRVRVTGREHVPKTGAFVLAPVHRSNVDFAIAACVTRRRLGYMAKDSLWRVPVLGPLISALGAYPVHRGTADREALRRARAVIERGEPVVVFPEGTRQSGPIVQELFEGAAYLAARAGIPIVPVGIGGSERAMPKGAKMVRPVRVEVIVGAPLWAEHSPSAGRAPRRVVHELTERLHKELQALFDQAQVRAGA